MSELRFETLNIPAADLFDVNPFIPMQTEDVHQEVKVDDSIPAEDSKFVGKGFKKNCLPYLIQDRYSRDLKDRDLKVAVLENELVKATFSLEYGGRLLSLYNKQHNKELLSVNPVFQPANLAIRNAWFSGGVEWNIGLIGHSPHTCSPLFTGRVTADDGTPVLRMYEYERIRKTPYQLDFYLKDGCPFLFVKVRIINPLNDDTFMYWWSNIAVEEREDIRVLVPANHCYRFGYEGVMKRIETPVDLNTKIDYTYTTNVTQSMDYFFRIKDQGRRWITALDKDGSGLVQTSTDLLKGRKLFVWGQSEGGDNWQSFLSHGQSSYSEIQAGLGLTQTEHLLMPPGEWSWLEAYGMLETDADTVHQSDWAAATQQVEDSLENCLARSFMDEEHERAKIIADKEMDELIQLGSGWACLENMRLAQSGQASIAGSSMDFCKDSFTQDQEAWAQLLETGAYTHTGALPAAPITDSHWLKLLEDAEKNYEGWYQLGVMYYAEERIEDAKRAWEQSIALKANPFALRCLAVLSKIDKDYEQALDYYKQAHALITDVCLTCEYVKTALDHKDFELALSIIEESTLESGRLILYKGYAWLGLNQYDKLEHLFNEDRTYTVIDLREGEGGFDELWHDMHKQKILQARNAEEFDDDMFHELISNHPVPQKYSFRMSPKMSPSERKAIGLDK